MDLNYEQYAVLGAQIKMLTDQKDKLKTQILADMEERGENKAETAVGNFKIYKLKQWTYTDKVAEMLEDYNERKAIEESTGEATFVEKGSLRFTKNNL